ncbi:MAG: ribosome biogenesis GTP-binding protein YihA/YsxC [Gemmatimonadaceae bacterium]|nr:ribosome biogenesis GTP-binding protein YihA/YsxC [Gemmatimonadaceae bacterium]
MADSSGSDPLVIRKLEFMGGMASASGWRPPPDLPEIAFAGRSNVGKSSLLNRLVRRKAFARVSRTPGRTREINFFRVNDDFILSDLPGYGYAKVSKEKKADWKPLIEGYLRGTPTLAGVVQLLDIRRDPSDDDVSMLDFLAELEIPTVAVLTKTDKLSRAAAEARARDITSALALSREQTIPFSATTGEGREELAEALVSLLAMTRGPA